MQPGQGAIDLRTSGQMRVRRRAERELSGDREEPPPLTLDLGVAAAVVSGGGISAAISAGLLGQFLAVREPDDLVPTVELLGQ